MNSAIPETIKKRFIRWSRHIWLTKRQQFVVATFLLTAGLLLTQLVTLDLRYPLVAVLSVAAYGLSAFVLREDINGIEWLTLLVLPTLFTAAVAMFYFLLPVRWLTRLPVAALYGIGMYALLLTENIYNFAADRTIALLRAAQTVGFLITVLTYFLLIQIVLAFRFYPVINVLIIGLFSFLLAFASLWSTELTRQVSRRVWLITLCVTLLLIQLIWVFSFMPAKVTLQSLLFTTVFYGSVGMGQLYLGEKLYKKNVIEFIIVNAIVFILTVFATSWHGGGGG